MWIKITAQNREPIELDCIDAIQFESTDPYWDKLQVTNFGFLVKDYKTGSLYIDNMQIPTNDIIKVERSTGHESLLKDADTAVQDLIDSLFIEDYISIDHGAEEHKAQG